MTNHPLTAAVETEKAVLISVVSSTSTLERVNEYLDELAFLLETAGGIAVKKFVQNLPYPDPKTYLGSGKLEDVATYIKDNQI